MLLSPVYIFFLFLFSIGISYLLATAFVFFGDIKHLYSVALTLWMYCSAIFYPVEQITGIMRTVILNNPLYVYILCMRKAVLYGTLPTAVQWLQMILWGAGMFLIGAFVYHRNRNQIMQKI